jgi:hypothetical protein
MKYIRTSPHEKKDEPLREAIGCPIQKQHTDVLDPKVKSEIRREDFKCA